MKKVLTVLCLLLAASLPLAAQAGVYMGINYVQMTQDNRFGFDSDAKTFNTGELFFKLGGVINQYVSTELRAGTTAVAKKESETAGIYTYDAKYQFNYHAGLYGKFGLPLGVFHPYILLGYTFGQEQVETFSGDCNCVEKTTGNLHDTSYGAGLDLDLGKRLGLNAEYTQYYDVGSVKFRGPSFGVYYRF